MEAPESLTARDIYEQIKAGKEVTLAISASEADQLRSHLSVIKSQEKTLWTDLGIEFMNKVLRVEQLQGLPIHFTFSLSNPLKNKRFTVFSITEPEVENP